MRQRSAARRLGLFVAASGFARSVASQADRRQAPRDDTFFFYRDEGQARRGTGISTDLEAWESALSSPNMTDRDTFRGFDVTKPYLEQEELDGFTTLLRITTDFKLPSGSEEDSDDDFTTVTSVSIVAPDEIAADNGTAVPQSIDPSWNLCFGYFYIDRAFEELGDTDVNCEGVLSEQCIDDTKTWAGERFQEADSSCPYQDGLPAATLPGSCDEDVYSDRLVQFRDLQSDGFASSRVFGNGTPVAGFSVGSGFNEKGDSEAYVNSGWRTVLVATVWGYNINDTSLAGQSPGPPAVSLSCVRGRRGVAEGSRDPGDDDNAGPRSRPSWTLLSLLVAFVALF